MFYQDKQGPPSTAETFETEEDDTAQAIGAVKRQNFVLGGMEKAEAAGQGTKQNNFMDDNQMFGQR